MFEGSTSSPDAFTTRRASGENARRIDESASALCKSHVANAGWRRRRFTIGTDVVSSRYLEGEVSGDESVGQSKEVGSKLRNLGLVTLRLHQPVLDSSSEENGFS